MRLPLWVECPGEKPFVWNRVEARYVLQWLEADPTRLDAARKALGLPPSQTYQPKPLQDPR